MCDIEKLRKVMFELMEARKGERENFMSLARKLILPSSQDWFESVFGKGLGKMLGHEYNAMLIEMEKALPDFFGCVLDRELTEVEIKCISKMSDRDATELQRIAMMNMERPVKLYTVRFVKPGSSMGISLWSFVYHEGEFRFVGKMNALQGF
ncbi:MAG: hypothetical protein QXT63_00010 [Thermoplasmata archaeon]